MKIKKGETVTLLLICAFVALIAFCFFTAGCNESSVLQTPKFKRGDLVVLRIDGRAQVLYAYPGKDEVKYRIRIDTAEGLKQYFVWEFELEDKPLR